MGDLVIKNILTPSDPNQEKTKMFTLGQIRKKKIPGTISQKKSPKNFHIGHFSTIFLPLPRNFYRMLTLYFPNLYFFYKSFHISPNSTIFAN